MAISYDDWKKQYEGMTTEQQKNYANMVKGNATAEAYAKQYIQEKQNAGSFGTQTANSYTNTNQSTNTSSSNNYSSNSNNQNGSTYDYSSNNTGSNNNNNTWTSNTWNTNTGNTGNTTSSWSPLSDWKNGNGWTYWKFTFDADEYLDESKFWKSNWEITVKEWTAAQTGRPDYEIETKERLTEMVNNLNTYWDSNPEFFNDRETFNRVFEYNTRQSQAQRDLLDSYWKKAQDYKKASSYNNSASFTSDLDSWNVSESEFEALKKYNQDVYIQWQKEMQDKLNAAIANLANPFSIDDMTTALNKIVEKFNLQAWDPYDIIWGWNQMMEKTWAWDSMNEAKKHFTAADDAIAQIKRIQSNYSSSTWGNQSDALVAARLQKALLPYETLLSNELSAWQHWQSLYNTQLGTANQYAQTIQMQAQEDQRIFNNKLKALWFAMEAYSYRTPEQQAQLQLQVSQISQDMALLNQSKQNDLALYNMAATTRLQNQLNYEMQDLTVTDPKQLRANLSNVLDQWYEQYWDIIQRPKSQVIEDVIAYAKANNMSVWEALRKNFIEPLMSKPEYQQAIRDAYKMNNKVEYIKTDNGIAILTTTPDWNVSVQYSNWWVAWNQWGTTWLFSNYTPISSNFKESALSSFISQHPLDSTWWECWAFVNDYLQSIWLDRLFVDPIDKKKAIKNSDTPTVWSVAIMDSKNYPQYWHTAIVTEISWDKVKVLESNRWDDHKVHERWINKSNIYWYFDPSKQISTQNATNISWDPHSSSIWTTSTWASVNGGWWITELEPYFSWQQKFMSTSDKKALLDDFWINNQDYMTMLNKYADWFSNTQLKKVLEENLTRAEDLLQWEKKENSWWWDYHTWWLDQASISTDAEWNSNAIMWITTAANAWYNKYKLLQNNQTLETYLNLKQQWATFWAMQQAEWELIAWSVNELNWNTKKWDFKTALEWLIQNYKAQLANLWISQDAVTADDIMQYAYSDIKSPNLNYSYDEEAVNFILWYK